MKRSHDGKITTFFKAKQRQSKEQCPGADDCNLLQHQDGTNETFATSSGDKVSLSQFEANNVEAGGHSSKFGLTYKQGDSSRPQAHSQECIRSTSYFSSSPGPKINAESFTLHESSSNKMDTSASEGTQPKSFAAGTSNFARIGEGPCHLPITSPYVVSGNKFQFQTKWFTRFPWLHFDNACNGVLCYPCCKAVNLNLIPDKLKKVALVSDLVNGKGIVKWNKAVEKFTAHMNSPIHKEALTKLGGLKLVSVNAQLSSLAKQQQENARVALKAIMESIKYLARQGLALRGHIIESGNLFQLNELRKNDIPELKEFLLRKKNYCSDTIQNEILEYMAHTILREIIEEVHESKIFSLIVDGTTDTSGHEQVSICVRILNKYEPEELSLGLYECASKTGKSVSDLILDVLLRCGLSTENLRGQCYDGGSNMRSACKGVQALMKEKQPLALFVHCGSHSLNLALQDTTKSIPLIRDVLSWTNDVGVMIRDSPKRMASFEDIKASEGSTIHGCPRPLCPTRWTVRCIAIHTILNNYSFVLSCLEELAMSKDDCTAKARGLHDHFLKGSVYFSLLVCINIFEPTEKLSLILQRSSLTLTGAKEAVSTVLEDLKTKRNEQEFENLWSQMLKKVEEFDLEQPSLPRVRRVPRRLEHNETQTEGHTWASPKDNMKSVYYETLDTICGEIEYRFNQPDFQEYCILEEILLSKSNEFTKPMMKVLNKRGISPKELKTELTMCSKIIHFSSISSTFTEFQGLHEETRSLFPHTEEILKTLIVIPATSATAERSFSMLRRIKNYLRSTMRQRRLNYLCLLNAYSERLENLDIAKLVSGFIASSEYRAKVFGNVL